MELTTRQKNILKEMQTRKPTLAERASKGEKSARAILTGMGFDCDYAEGDMDGPKNYSNNE